ncbi:MAG: Holliday junction resolvase RuvX [Synechococcales cyanobacterium RU_4_20]|nr:Holliday junction resolvase RuvX [Synechococcales cyanobacterium RU_4_20]NJR70819.1 Holliday junction resolvase RuvX [Synechococcales cyanobacterium CRU_2_2]
MQRISALGIDVGRKRIGIAGCDGTGLLSTGLTTLRRSAFAQDVEQFRQIVQEREVQVLIFGLPYTLDGEVGPQAQQVQRYASGLARALALPMEYVDERLSSVEAEERLQAAGYQTSRNKALIDREAAAIILQRWLDRRRDPVR